MINSTYLYSFFLLFGFGSLFYFFLNFRSGKSEINNKILLKNLLEGLEMELPDELKALDNSSTDPQKFSQLVLGFNLMSKFNFDDTETSGIWWSTNVSIRDLCVELKADTSCGDSEIAELLRSIAKSIEVNGL